MITNDAEAREIAALWQSSGSIGRHLAAFASGAWHADDLDQIRYEDEEVIETRRDHLLDDIDRTLGTVLNDDDRAELYDLRSWVESR